MTAVRLTVIVPTIGRNTLDRTLQSCAGADETIVVFNENDPYGNRSRMRATGWATGTHLMFIDDDDAYTDGAFQHVRAAVRRRPGRVHIFQMRLPNGEVVWHNQQVHPGNVGTPMWVVPNRPGKVGVWEGDGATSDHDFIRHTMSLRGDEPVWHSHVIATVRP